MNLPGKPITPPSRMDVGYAPAIITWLLINVVSVFLARGKFQTEHWYVFAFVSIGLLVGMLVAGPRILGVFVQAAIADDGLWFFDGKNKIFVPWENIASLALVRPLPGRGLPSLIVLDSGGNNWRIQLLPTNELDIATIAAKSPQAKKNF